MTAQRRAPASRAFWALVAIVVMGAGARLYRLGDKSYWLDEATSVYLARLQFMGPKARQDLGLGGRVGAMVDKLKAHDAHPPAHQILLLLALEALGPEEWAARLPSAAAGILTILLLWRLGTRLFDRTTGLAAAALAAASAHLIFFSQEARLYSLLALITVAHANLLADLLARRRRDWARWVLYALLGAAGLWTYALYGAVIVGHWLFWGLYAAERRRRLVLFVAVQLVVCAGFAPWVPQAMRIAEKVRWGLDARPEDRICLSPSTAAAGVLDAVAGAQYSLAWTSPALSQLRASGRLAFAPAEKPSDFFLRAGFLWVAGAVAVGLGAWRRGRRGARLYALCFAPILLVLAAPAPRVHVFETKHVFFAVPFLLLAAAASVSGLGRLDRLGRVLVAILLAANVWAAAEFLNPAFEKEPWRRAIAEIERDARPGDLLIFSPPFAPAPYFAYGRKGLRFGTPASLDRLNGLSADRLWLVELEDSVAHRSGVWRRTTRRRRMKGKPRIYPGYLGAIRVTLFERPDSKGETPRDSRPTPAVAENEILSHTPRAVKGACALRGHGVASW